MINKINIEVKILRKDFYPFASNSKKGRLVIFGVWKEFKKDNGRWTVEKEMFLEITKITTKSFSNKLKVGDKLVVEGKLGMLNFNDSKKLVIYADQITHIPRIVSDHNSVQSYEIVEDALF